MAAPNKPPINLIDLMWRRKASAKPCEHKLVPRVKSHYSSEMVRRGRCPQCGNVLLELD